MVTNPVEGPRLMTSDGVELATRSWSCDGEPHAIVILVHGLSSTKDDPHVVDWPNVSGPDRSMCSPTIRAATESPKGSALSVIRSGNDVPD